MAPALVPPTAATTRAIPGRTATPCSRAADSHGSTWAEVESSRRAVGFEPDRRRRIDHHHPRPASAASGDVLAERPREPRRAEPTTTHSAAVGGSLRYPSRRPRSSPPSCFGKSGSAMTGRRAAPPAPARAWGPWLRRLTSDDDDAPASKGFRRPGHRLDDLDDAGTPTAGRSPDAPVRGSRN